PTRREGEAGRDRRARSAGGTAGDIRRVPGIAAIAVMTIVAGTVLREPRHVQAGKSVSASRGEPLDDRGAVAGHEILANGRAAGGEAADLVVHILVRERQAVQRSDRAARGELCIGGAGRGE